MKTSKILWLVKVGILLASCKQEGSTNESAFVKAALAENPSLVSPATQPLDEDEDRLVSQSLSPADFSLDTAVPFDVRDVAAHQTISDTTPAPLQGIWWMNGNPLADKTVSFANLKLSPKGGKQVGYFAVFGANNYTYTADMAGENLYKIATDLNGVYELTFNNDITYGEIVPTMKIGPIRVRIPARIIKFTMTQKNDGYFLRESSVFGKALASYDFVRIIDKNRLPVTATPDNRWENYLKSPTKIVIPKLKG